MDQHDGRPPTRSRCPRHGVRRQWALSSLWRPACSDERLTTQSLAHVPPHSGSSRAGVAANANVAAPIDAAASANVLSFGSGSQALADQGTLINQGITGDATAHSVQDSGIDQGTAAPADSTGTAAPATTDPASAGATAGATLPAGTTGGVLPTGSTTDLGATAAGAAGALNGNLLNVDVNLDANAGIAAPINGAVAANANVAAPIDAAVAANIGSIDSDAISVAHQDAIINQDINGNATAGAEQQSTMKQ